jgi:hypothetical protein
MNTQTRKSSLYDRHPELKISPEELKKRNDRLLATLQRFVDEGDEQEQRETGDVLMAALAEARESNRENRT